VSCSVAGFELPPGRFQRVCRFDALEPGPVDVDRLKERPVEGDQVVDVGAIGRRGQPTVAGVPPTQADFTRV
jgi:hypothetical protein